MEIIIHRINKVKELKKIDIKFGTEIDIRTKNSKLILNHEPYSTGDTLINYLDEYKHGTLILNIKESGIEDDVIKIIKKYKKINKYFLLDVEMPYIFKCLKNNEKNIAIRISDYENINSTKKFVNKLNWVWIDTYKSFPIKNQKDVKSISSFKKCLVCPERWGRKKDIVIYKNKLKSLKLDLDAVMTSYKTSNFWIK